MLDGAQVEIQSEKQPPIYLIVGALGGRYLFTSLPPNFYTAREINPPGYTSTTPDKIRVEVRANTRVEVNFGDILSATATATSSPTATPTLWPTKTPTPEPSQTPPGPYRLYLPLVRRQAN